VNKDIVEAAGYTLQFSCDDNGQCISMPDLANKLIQLLGVRLPVSGADFMSKRKTVPPLLQMAGHGGTTSRRTAYNKLTKLYTDHRESAHHAD